MPCYSPLKGYMCKETGGLKFKTENTQDTMEVACGQCLGCRLDRSRMWAARIVHESSLHDHDGGNSFVTLTYRSKAQCTKNQLDEKLHIPEDWNLSVPIREAGKQTEASHFQLFMKRLRKRYKQKIKYFMCGEYGAICKHGINLDQVGCPLCNVGRPHYHACLFNVEFNDLEPYASRDGVTRYTSKTLEGLWKYGFVDVGKLEYQSAAYVARYCLKKVTGVNAEEHYQSIDYKGEVTKLNPEYATMSNGIGEGWYEKYKDDVFPSDEVPVPGHGIIKKVPRYYEEKYKESDPFDYEEVKNKRQIFRRENADEYEPDRLMAKYKVKKAQNALFSKRNEENL